ncbi:MAG: hypothetical protein SFX19_04800 [Alphaproteobacteria bacterium]|nr:hypothetical protein [Alphaproteobacteria bacterium]
MFDPVRRKKAKRDLLESIGCPSGYMPDEVSQWSFLQLLEAVDALAGTKQQSLRIDRKPTSKGAAGTDLKARKFVTEFLKDQGSSDESYVDDHHRVKRVSGTFKQWNSVTDDTLNKINEHYALYVSIDDLIQAINTPPPPPPPETYAKQAQKMRRLTPFVAAVVAVLGIEGNETEQKGKVIALLSDEYNQRLFTMMPEVKHLLKESNMAFNHVIATTQEGIKNLLLTPERKDANNKALTTGIAVGLALKSMQPE